MTEKNIILVEVSPLVDIKVIKETLSRIGICNFRDRIIYPSCYLYEENGKFYLTHFKELFLITRESSYDNMSDSDKKRRNAIAFCLKNWGLIDVSDELISEHNVKVDVLPFKEKANWQIKHKFNFNSISITME